MTSIARMIQTQWKIRKDLVFFAGCGYIAFGTDHLFFKRIRLDLYKAGIYHKNKDFIESRDIL